MRHIHKQIVICAALAVAPLVLNANTSAFETNSKATAAFGSLANTLSANPQDDIQASGRVVDETGSPITGVSVVLQGTNHGTISDTEGNFSISAPEDAILVFSMKGYYQQQIEVRGRAALGDIIMVKDNSAANEIDIAFRKVDEDDLIGSISHVNVEENMKSNHTWDALENMNAYVGGWNGSTLWGMNPNNSSYYVVVDGVPRGLSGVENLLSSEIESITFMKGADAVALYGTRGVKGAILITTKRGQKQDGLSINASVNTGFNVAKQFPEYLSSAEYMTYYNQALKSDGLDPLYSEEDIYNHASGKNPYRYPNTDYYSSDYIGKVYNRTDANIELIGGSERAKYYGCINYWTAGDYLKIGDAKDNRTHRYSVRGNVDVKINDFISAYINSNATFYDVKTAGNADWWGAAAGQRPNRPVNAASMIPVSMIDPNNQAALDMISTTKNIYDGKFLSGTQDEPTSVFGDIYAAGSSKYTIRKFQFDAGMNFDLSSALEGLSFKTILGMDFATEYTTAFSNKYAIFIPEWADYNGQEYIVGLTKEGNDERNGYQSISGSVDNRMITVTGLFDYTRSFGNHNINAIVLASGSQETKAGAYHSDCSAHMGFHVGYNFAHKYYVDFNSALVHSIRLAEGHRNAFSPSVTVAWDMAKESFLKGSFVNKLQIEASASILNEDWDLVAGGNKYYLYDGVWAVNDWGFTWHDGYNAKSISPSRGENPEMRMIQRKELRTGLRSSFLNGMFTLNGNFFYNEMDGYLISSGNDYPSHMTEFVPYRNNNIISRIGGDYEFTYNQKFGGVDFSMGIFGTYYTTTLKKYEETPKYDYLTREGSAEDKIWGYKCLGIFQSQDEIDNSPVQNLGSEVKPGDLKYADINGDDKVDNDDVMPLGKYGSYGSPSVIGVHFNVKWKNFTFFLAGSGHFESKWIKSGSQFSTTYNEKTVGYFQMDEDDKYSAIARDCWSESNKNAAYPRISTKANSNNFVTSDFWLYSEDAFVLDKVQITYDLPAQLFGESFVKGVSVYAMGANLLTISPQRELLELRVGSSPYSRYYGIGVRAKF